MQLVVETRRLCVVKLERAVAEDKEKVVGAFSKFERFVKSNLAIIESRVGSNLIT